MSFMPIIGHVRLRQRVAQQLAAGSLPQVSLFYGVSGIGKRLVALETAGRLLCEQKVTPCGTCDGCLRVIAGNHPDLIWVKPTPPKSYKAAAEGAEVDEDVEAENKKTKRKGGVNLTIKVDDVKAAKARLVYQPLIGRHQVLIIDEAHLMNVATGNSLLKILEEPRPHLVVMLITSRFHRILPTLRSRSAKIPFVPLTPEEVVHVLKSYPVVQKTDSQFLFFLARAFQGSAGTVIKALESGLTQALLDGFSASTNSVADIQKMAKEVVAAEVDLRLFLQAFKYKVLEALSASPAFEEIGLLEKIAACDAQIDKHIQRDFILESLFF
jgi:DNA polymerase III gamma/tau subunit